MMVEPGSSNGYAKALDAYWNAGWRGILPLRRGFKGGKNSGLPTGYTGHEGVDPSYPDLLAWADMDKYRDGNLCLRLPDGIIGIDVDAYGAKTGERALAEAVGRWGSLPAGPRTTSRGDDPISGIRLFRVPPGTMLEDRIVFPELGIGDIELVQHHHRYAVCWPSIHPEGREYWWRNEAMQLIGIPDPTELPELPQPWIDALSVTRRSFEFDGQTYNVRDALTDGEPSPIVRERIAQAIRELNLPGQSRHDTCCRHVMALMRLGKSGQPGVKSSLQLLCSVLVAARQVDKSDTPEGTRAEFLRMITNDNAAKELSQPGLLDWFYDLDPAKLSDDAGNNDAPSRGKEGASSQPTEATATGEAITVQSSRIVSDLEGIERGFWDSRESLRMVWQTSMANLVPPWSVLAICAARALAQVRPHAVLPPVISRRGSLNWFGAIVAGPAGGKTTSGEVAEYLVPGHILTCYQGTGEGILASFGAAGDPSDPNCSPEHEAVMLDVDEIDSLGAVSSRTGSTMMPILRSAFSGATLAFSYANRDKRRYVRKHTYRMTGIVGMQPKRAGWILADSDGGTPQRFMWFPATDSRMKRNRPWETGPLTLPAPGEWQYPRTIVIPKSAEELLVTEHVRRQQGDTDALNGHALFCREKFAYALTVLDGRIEMSEEDWELSGIAYDVSMFTREKVIDELKAAARIEALDRGEIRGIELAAADESKEFEEAERVRAALRWALAKIEAAGSDGISTRDLTQAANSKRIRKWLSSALSIGQSNGLIRVLDGTTIWVKI